MGMPLAVSSVCGIGARLLVGPCSPEVAFFELRAVLSSLRFSTAVVGAARCLLTSLPMTDNCN